MQSASCAGSAAGAPVTLTLLRASTPPDPHPAGKPHERQTLPTPVRQNQPLSAAQPADGSQAAPGRCVLLVEDDELLRGAMKMVLEWEGYRVACAGDGQEALDYLRAGERPALILLDVMLPVLDGLQFRQEQQRDPGLANVPVVVVSALDAADCPAAAAHLRKPFAVEALLDVVRRQS
jgi:CheY-like chemotaxis protein